MPLSHRSATSFSRSLTAVLLVLLGGSIAAHSQDMLTYHNNNSRNGLDNKETTLTLTNVNSASFGKLFTVAADGLVDAEPLYVSAVTIGGRQSQPAGRGERA